MARHEDLRTLSLSSLAHRCALETDSFFQRRSHDPRYCFELFRRALSAGSQRAWDLVYRQYRPLVAGWVHRHPAYASCAEETQYLVNRAFEKMWSAIGAERFDRFVDLKSLLRYLQLCVHSVLVDQVRAVEQGIVDQPVDEVLAEGQVENPGDGGEHLADVDRREFWAQVLLRLKSEEERIVMLCSFVIGMKPREMCEAYPETFAGVREVYRIKENLLARLRRDIELKELLGEYA